jgi:hypothetical protein
MYATIASAVMECKHGFAELLEGILSWPVMRSHLTSVAS